MNGSRVRGGEGRFITFVFFFEDKKGDSIENNKIKGYKSTLTTPHPGPISYNKKITGNLKNSIIFFRFTTTFPEYSIILFKTVQRMSQTRTGMNYFTTEDSQKIHTEQMRLSEIQNKELQDKIAVINKNSEE